MKYYIIAGEASGDLHGANLIKALLQNDAECSIRFWGGDLMTQASKVAPTRHYRDLDFMGFVEVIKHLPAILKNISFCKNDILQYKPDALILIDYPGFNLRIASWAHEQGIKVFYYISPQIWAWKESRVHTIKKVVDKMFVILPFEKDFYKKYNYDVEYVGHPLIDVIEKCTFDDIRKKYDLSPKPIIALLPGSRKQEVKNNINIFLQVYKEFPDYQFIIAAAPSLEIDYYTQIIGSEYANIKVIKGETYNILHAAHAAIVTSGTATLETALFKVPQVVCYKGNYLSYLLATMLIKVKYISLPNLILNKPLLKELIQTEFNTTQLTTALHDILKGEKRKEILEGYDLLNDLLYEGDASNEVALKIFQSISKN
ncbi:MAG: lipid-A-disaccharide synthase [Saprospiraceae bacterium]|nr:lipid-A-disaccharide synthase [Saprospiraceae bacterium]